MHTIRTLIVDDHPAVLRSLALLVGSFSEFSIVGQASCGEQALERAAAKRPQLVLLDVNLGTENGFRLAPQIRALAPDCRLVMMSINDRPEYHRSAQEAGAEAFIAKSALIDWLSRQQPAAA